MTFEQAKDHVAYKLYKTDYKYIALNLCKVNILEEAAELYAQSKAEQAWDDGFTAGYSTGTFDDIMNKPTNPYKK